jgi:hypothetical protein
MDEVNLQAIIVLEEKNVAKRAFLLAAQEQV